MTMFDKLSPRPAAVASSKTPAPHVEPDSPQIEYVRWLTQMSTDVATTVAGVLQRGARAVQIGVSPGTTKPLSSPGTLLGYALRNTDAANPATVLLRDGCDANALLVVPVALAAKGFDVQWFAPGGINLSTALFADIAGGPVDGCVFLGA